MKPAGLARWTRSTARRPSIWRREERPTLDEARAWCHQLATSHYENFHVATFFLP